MNWFDLDKIVQDAATFDGSEQSAITCLVHGVVSRQPLWAPDVVLRRLLGAVMRHLASDRSPEFFMVYREGGRPPAFKHSTAENAMSEARRIARESGERTYVLAATEAIDPWTTPSVEEFRKHADIHGKDGIGMWKFVPKGGPNWIPALLAIIVMDGEAWVCSGSGCRMYVLPENRLGQWTPLDEQGEQLDDIPF